MKFRVSKILLEDAATCNINNIRMDAEVCVVIKLIIVIIHIYIFIGIFRKCCKEQA